MPTANYEDCPRCVGQACQTYIKYAIKLTTVAMSVTEIRAKDPAGGLKFSCVTVNHEVSVNRFFRFTADNRLRRVSDNL